ncbi:MAG: hypothetical protein HY429_00740 [Candidatus Levybacteria bacterium]|nr:hypothetical protein [Candidatus Levybacteria bacterium]
MADAKKIKSSDSHPKIEIPDPQLQIKQFEYFIAEKVQSIEKSFSFHNNVIIAIFLLGFVIMFFTVIGLAFQAWQFATAYQRESIQLKLQEDLITNTVRQQQLLIESQGSIKKDTSEIKDSLNQ